MMVAVTDRIKIAAVALSCMVLRPAFGRSAEAQPGFHWIKECIAPVRSQPKSQANPVANVRIGTSFYSTKASGDWIYVDSIRGRPVHGWVSSAMVSDAEVDSAYLLKQLQVAKSFADSVKGCERLVALSPGNRMFMKALQKGYLALGDTAKAAYFGREIRGTNPIYLARNDGVNTLIIGALDSTAEFQPLLWREAQEGSSEAPFAPREPTEKAIKKKALRLKAALPSMVWYPIGRVDVPGWMLHVLELPAIVPDPRHPATVPTDIDGQATFGVALGAFYDLYTPNGMSIKGYTEDAVIFASRPLYRVPVSGMILSSQKDSLVWYQKHLAGNAFDTVGVTDFKYRSLDGYGYVEAFVAGRRRDRITLVAQRGIFSPTRKLVWPPEETLGCSNDAMESIAIEPEPPWFRFGPDASFPAFSVQPFTSNYSLDKPESQNGISGYSLVKISAAGSKIYTVRSEYGGD